MASRSTLAPALVIAATCVLVLGAACGGGAEFTPEEFVAAANKEGAGLELGERLLSSDGEAEIYGLELASHGGGEAKPDSGQASLQHAHGGGSLVVTESDDGGVGEYERCEAASTLLCYRAANVVLIFEDSISSEDSSALADALRALASE